jgi:hypothetical protein
MPKYVTGSRALALVKKHYSERNISTIAIIKKHRELWDLSLREAVAELAGVIRRETRDGYVATAPRSAYCEACGLNVSDADCDCPELFI